MRRMEPRQTGNVTEWRHAVSVKLDKDEFLPYRGQLFLRGTPSWGELFLTTKRLIWIRMRIGLPFGRKLVEVPLSDIESWSIEPVPWWSFRRFGRRRMLIRIRTISDTYDVVTTRTREDADEWVEALDNVMTGAGIVKGVAHA